MKIQGLLLIVVFFGLSVFNLKQTFDVGNASIKIVSKQITEAKAGEVIYFSVNLCSVENLKNFTATPNITGENPDSFFTFTFNKTTNNASVNYFYIVPENLKAGNNLEITFLLDDGKVKTEKHEMIKIIE